MSSNIHAPRGISRADALVGLWKCSKPAFFFQTLPNGDEVRKGWEAEVRRSREKIEEMIQRDPRVGYFGGRCIQTDMSQYPKLDLSDYKRLCEIPMSYEEIFERCLQNPYPGFGFNSIEPIQ